MNYFAYELDLSKLNMAKCCPKAKPLAKAVLPNFKLVFAGWSREWKGPVATIRRSNGEKVTGGVYQVGPEEELRLDRIHGYPAQFDKIRVMVFDEAGGQLESFAYIMKDQARQQKPSLGYLKSLQQAYRDWGLL